MSCGTRCETLVRKRLKDLEKRTSEDVSNLSCEEPSSKLKKNKAMDCQDPMDRRGSFICMIVLLSMASESSAGTGACGSAS